MRNHGLFSTLFIDDIRTQAALDDAGRGRMATLRHTAHTADRNSGDTLWNTFIKQVLGYLSFVPPARTDTPGMYPLYEDYGFSNAVAVLCLAEPRSDLGDATVGRFLPGKLIAQLRQRKLNWGILTDGDRWRLYTTRTGKPFEEYVELPLSEALTGDDEKEYALFERCFHVDSFTPDLEDEAENQEGEARELGVYTCRLDRDMAASEKILEEKVKSPLLAQIDEVLQYLCNGFIAETPRKGDAYTDDERREIFASTVKLLYRCLFLFYAEARSLLPSQIEKREIYAEHSIGALCREAHRFRWGKRTDHDGYDLWKHLKGLIGAVNDGDPEYGIMGYNGGLFDDEEEKFLGKEQLRNDFLSRALYLMAWVEPHDGDAEKEYPIPYLDLEVRHLGEMYETILEFTVTLADADRIRRKSKKGVEILLASEAAQRKGDSLIRKGEVWFGESALERKQTGSYYTPESLVHFLNAKAVIGPLRDRFEKDCRERFDLFIQEAKTGHDVTTRRGAAQSAIALLERFVREVVLRFRLCDPAMGSGHFLVNAANQITDFIVSLLAEIPHVEGMAATTTCEPNDWRRLITRHCLHGVDMNPLAVHLAKLSLWLNGFARDHKLTFLDHHLRCGNSLIGIRSLSQLEKIPERAKDAKRKNRDEQQVALPLPESLTEAFREAARDLAAIADIAEDDTDRQKEIHAEAWIESITPLIPLADLYTAYLMDGAVQPNDYEALFLRLSRGDGPASVAELELNDKVNDLARSHRFFHWPLEFPDVFTGEGAGFDADVGNPPWDVLQPSTQEFYTQYDPNFRKYGKQEALKRIKELHEKHPDMAIKWEAYSKSFQEAAAYAKEPAAFLALTVGKIDLYRAFLERFFHLLREGGRLGIVAPSGFYTDQGCLPLRRLFLEHSRIECLYGFENRWPTVFPAVDGRFKFILFCTERGADTESFRCAFMQHDPQRLPVIEAKASHMSPEKVRRYSPDSLTLMEFRSQQDADVADKIYGKHPLLGGRLEDAWNVELSQEFNMSSDSHLFNVEGRGCPLYEGKLIWSYDHQFSPVSYWIEESIVRRDELRSRWRVLKKKKREPKVYDYQLYRGAFRNIAASTNERTFLATIIPKRAVCPHTNLVIRRMAPDNDGNPIENIGPSETAFLVAVLNSFISDFIIRFKITTHLDMHFVNTMPIPRLRETATLFLPIVARCARLVCVDESYADLWKELYREDFRRSDFWYPSGKLSIDSYGPEHEQVIRRGLAEQAANLTPKWVSACGVHDRKADRRDTGDRAQLRAEIDAYVAHLYGLSRDEFAYILGTFPVLKRKEEQAFGEFMSKRKCLEEYDRIGHSL
ncbi:MAG TPA: hypothetical protein PKH03_00055 [Syntrophales bacterium]|nr:hypothetical protein [Syntrophales bacterium]